MNITVYCGANSGNKEIFEESTILLGHWIVENNDTLVYGGGKAGLMGLLADSVINAGGKVIGIIPTFLKSRELAHPNLTELNIVNSMSERKLKMFDLADAFIALPGGPGTLEEITEMISWARIGQNSNPCIFFNIDGYYDPLKQMYEDMEENGFLTKKDREKILFSSSVNEMSDFIKNYTPPIIRQY